MLLRTLCSPHAETENYSSASVSGHGLLLLLLLLADDVVVWYSIIIE